jgi:hypothetical protein
MRPGCKEKEGMESLEREREKRMDADLEAP